jgi:NAD(P)-dependent dehydrogenase (short-subunit alcohol dehydrogenase family)
MRKLKGRVAVITGAAMGMGRDLALRLHREGCDLALCDLDLEALHKVKAECGRGGKISVHKVDVADRQQIKAFAKAVADEHGTAVNLLFNNAGIARPQLWDRMSEEMFDKVLAVNLDGVVSMTRAFWDLLVRADEAVVVNTSSVAGFFPPASGGCAPYTVSKYAVRGFSEHLALECKLIAPHVRVCVVHPGMIDTKIVKNSRMDSVDPRRLRQLTKRFPSSRREQFEQMTDEDKLDSVQNAAQDAFRRFGKTSKEAADMIIDGVQAGKLRILVGWDAVIMDWWVRMFPTIVMSETGAAIVGITSVVGRHVYKPLAIVAMLGLLLGAVKRRSRL